MRTNIKKCFGTGVLSFGLLLAAGIHAFATNSRMLNLMHDVVLHGKALQAGIYSVEWKTHRPKATVQFTQRYRVVLFTEGRVERRQRRYTESSVVYDLAPDGTKTLIEVRFAKSNKVLVFDHNIPSRMPTQGRGEITWRASATARQPASITLFFEDGVGW